MSISRFIINNKVVQHLTFWVLLFLVYALGYGGHEQFYWNYIETTLSKFPFYIIAAYSFNYWLVPHLLKKKKTFLFSLSLILTSFAIVAAFKLVQQMLSTYPQDFLNLPSYLSKTLMFYMPALMIYAYQTEQQRQAEKARLLLVEKEKSETELKYLKAQLNPHFLFNTLNNLYSFVVNQSPKAADMVLQLSEILDYVLYKSQAKLVALSEEVKSIENYIALEQTRYGDRLDVSFEQPTDLINQNIAPLLLLSIVENAFKHGASGTVSEPEIRISIRQNEGQIEFNVWNTKGEHFKGAKNDSYKEGIGIGNIKKQLNLTYPDNHKITIQEGSAYFNLNLIITTA